MNKQEIIEQIDELKQRIKQLEKEVSATKTDKSIVRWQPILGQYYFYLGAILGNVETVEWCYDDIDYYRYDIGNCFETKQEAEDYKENLLTKQALKDLALELNNGVEIDWNNDKLTKYCIFISCVDELYLHSINSNKHLGQVYCYNKDFLTIAKERIGEEKLIKLIKSGV